MVVDLARVAVGLPFPVLVIQDPKSKIVLSCIARQKPSGAGQTSDVTRRTNVRRHTLLRRGYGEASGGPVTTSCPFMGQRLPVLSGIMWLESVRGLYIGWGV